MRRLFDGLPKYIPSLLVGVVVTLAIGFAFSNIWIGFGIGASIAIVLAWEERLH